MKDLLEGLHASNKGTFPKSRVFMAGLLGGDPSQLALDSGGTSSIIQGKLEEPDHSSANWYFPREELEKTSPSLLDGIDIKRETYFRKSYCTFLQDLGMRLKVPQVTIATAITFCHRFYLRQSHAKNDRSMIATVCMFLAGKVEETPRTLKDVIIVSYGIRHKKDPAAVNRIKQKEVYEQQKEFVLHGERLVLTTLGFDLNVHHPYRPLVAAIKRFKVAQHALAQVAWNFVNDGLRTSLCLQFKPHHIAAGAIFLAAKFLKVKLPNDGEKLWWQEFDVTPRQLEEVSNQMLELYEQNKVAPTSRSDPNPDDINSERNGLDSAVPAANGHYGTSSMASEPKGRSSGKRDTGGDIETRDGFMSGSSELERGQLKQKQVTDEARRSDSVDRRRVSMSNQNERASDMLWQPEQAETVPEEEFRDAESGPEAADRMDRLQESTGKRKREVNERKWVKSSERAEEGELPSRAEEHFHSSRATGDKRHEASERDHGRREAGQDGGYRHHSEHHSNYHYQRGDGERSRTHSKDRDWQDREQKKSRHK